MFTPTILPADELLAPVSVEMPAGDDLRLLGDEIDEIIRAGTPDKGSALARGGTELATVDGPRVVDWNRVISLSQKALRKSKDLVVVARLTEAMVAKHGLAGLREGLWLSRQIIERYWDGLFPSMEDGNVEYRAQPFTWLNDKLAWRIKELPAPEAHLAPSAVEAAVEVASGCQEEFLAVYQLLERLCGRDAPKGGRLHEAIGGHVDTATTLLDRKRKELEAIAAEQSQAAEETARAAEAATAAAAVEARAVEEAEAARRASMISGEPQDAADAFGRLVKVAVFLRREAPQSAIPFRLLRFAQWADAPAWAHTPPAQPDLSAPPTETRAVLRQLEQAGDWAALVEACEEATATPAGRFWLDPQRQAVTAFEHLGEAWQAPRQAVLAELQRLVVAFPALPSLYLADFTATADPGTQTWITTTVVAPTLSASAGTVDPPEKQVDAWREALMRARAGRKLEALELLEGEVARARSGREAFSWRLRLAELCLQERLPHLAVPVLEELSRTVDRLHLDEWETPETCARVFAALHQSYQLVNGSKGNEDRAREAFDRLCRLDIGWAFRERGA